MAPSRKKYLDDAVVGDSDDETVDGEEVEEEEEEENDAVETEDGTAKSDDDADDADEEEDENDEDEEEEKTEKPLLPSSSAAASEEDPESESETDSDNTNQSPSTSAYTIKPIVSKPINAAVKPSKKTPPPKPKSGSKRPAEADPPKPKDSKKKKVASGGGDDEDAKRGRLWSEDDEIAILKGLIEFQSKKGPVNAANVGQFHEFVKKNLQAEVVTGQLGDKIKRLRRKYQDNAKKGGENGQAPEFSKPHELKSFDLSKKVWGVEANGVDDNAKGGKGKPRKSNKGNKDTVLALPVSDSGEKKEELSNVDNGGVKADPDDFWSMYPCLRGSLRSGNCSLGEDLARIMIEGMPLIGCSKVKELEEKWRALQVNEMELSVKKLDLMQEQAKLVLDSMKSSKD